MCFFKNEFWCKIFYENEFILDENEFVVVGGIYFYMNSFIWRFGNGVVFVLKFFGIEMFVNWDFEFFLCLVF